MAERYKITPSVHIYIIKEGKILLGRRYHTGFMDGKYAPPAGHFEEGEAAHDAAIRELREEVGLIVVRENLSLAHVAIGIAIKDEYVNFFFVVDSWEGEPTICEPEKSDDLSWFSLDDLPEMIPHERYALEQYRKGILYSEYGHESS